MKRILGPLLDRIDLHIEMEAQLTRQGVSNARIPASQVDDRLRPDPEGRRLLREAGARLGLSARAHHRVLRVARTVADLAGSSDVRIAHVAEALHYRGLRTPAAVGTGAKPS